jgi:hypothetical protein
MPVGTGCARLGRLTVCGYAVATALAVSTSASAAAAPSSFQTDLRPMPVDDETKAVIAGHGRATAAWDGRALSVQGTFEGLPSNATEAFLMQSPYIAVPGRKIADLTVTRSTAGEVTGSVRLNRAQAEALRTGNLYIQVNSEKAPPGYKWGPQGTVWGWLLPAHETVGPGVPQMGEFYVPRITSAAR